MIIFIAITFLLMGLMMGFTFGVVHSLTVMEKEGEKGEEERRRRADRAV